MRFWVILALVVVAALVNGAYGAAWSAVLLGMAVGAFVLDLAYLED
jgi:hypothetical protein